MVGIDNEKVRNEWLADVLTRMPSGLRLLDAGAGELANQRFCKHLDYISQDFCQYEGEGDSKGLQTNSWNTKNIDIVSDIVSIPEPDESFDVILCSEVFEHLPDPVSALKELARLTKPGGQIIITAPFCSLTHFSPYHFSTGFNRYFYQHHFDALGFDIVEISSNGNFFEYMGQEISRIETVARQFAKGRLSRLERYSMRILLKALERFSAKDEGSQELLCFGYHVIAVKRTKFV
ncbi:methyltransferase domain-containing protein [Alcaligenaceae bacterium]|nr:methyltransferase domain-containing protein [Alcaligenaceae bacterium]